MTARGPWPAPGAADVCVDTPLLVPLSRPTAPEELGRVEIRHEDGTLEDVIDPAEPDGHRRTVGGAVSDTGRLHWFRYHPVLDVPGSGGRLLEVRPRVTLRPGQRYRVRVDGGPCWELTTRARPADGPVLRVAADGTGDYCTVQGAVDAVPRGNQHPVLITIAPGRYREIVYVPADKPHLTLRGAGRERTVIGYPNNQLLNGMPSGSRCPRRRLGDRDLHNGWRATVGVEADDVRLEDLTCENTTPRGGSQAEAFRGNADRTVLHRVVLRSHQDTLRLQGTGFVAGCRVEGDVDAVWGTGAVHHWRSEYRSLGPGYLMQIRNGAGERGHVLVDCRLTATPEVPAGSVRVARTDPRAFPHSEAVLLDCQLGAHLAPDRWLVQPDDGSARERFLEHGSRDADGSPLPVDPLRVLDDPTRWRDPAHTLDGWVPATVDVTGVDGAVEISWSAPVDHRPSDELVLCAVDGSRRGSPVAVGRLGSAATTGEGRLPLPDAPGRYRVGLRSVRGGSPTVWSEDVEVTR
ncbi:pectinesterase family protein [Desertihabitans aurantiacus]|uniref:pectinesterase family protein n=1 Tax=Desertihabitans aurantiacus TaxID=2282477 RepID=UPI000DF723D6|nr:pectinesterase family protein [Desertihabitans aurantiacus]